MDLTIKDFDEKEHVVEVGVDDALGHLRLKVASAAGLQEDSFQMTFRGEVLREEEGIKELSAGDTIILRRTAKFAAIAALHALGETDLTKERLATVDDADVARLLLEAEVATETPAGFLQCSTLTRLDLSAVSVVTEIGDWFLSHCQQLTEVDLSGLCNVTVIGANFITFDQRLESINLSGFGSVTEIGEGFLTCSALRTVDLSVFRRVTVIEGGFIRCCCHLMSVDLSGLSNVTEIGDYFLSNCSAEESLSFGVEECRYHWVVLLSGLLELASRRWPVCVERGQEYWGGLLLLLLKVKKNRGLRVEQGRSGCEETGCGNTFADRCDSRSEMQD